MGAWLFVQEAIEALAVNKLRSFLTMLGIIIGIAAIVIIIAVGNGAQSLIINQIASFGTDLVGVTPGASDEDGPPAAVMGVTVTTLKLEDAEAIRQQVPGIEAASGYVKGTATVAWANQNVDTSFTGVNSDYPKIEKTEMALGNFYTDDDDRSLRNVTVLGWQVYQDLFNDSDPLGQMVRIKRTNFRVIGVLKERGTEAFQNQDNQVFVPLLTAQKKLLGISHISLLRAKVVEGYDVDQVTSEVRLLLRERHDIEPGGVDDFRVENIARALDILGSITDVLKYFLAAISSLALLVGGIGIMNIMLVTVLERTREIGLRKALGARPFDLRLQFLSETIIISSLGGLVGFAIGAAVAYLIAVAANAAGYHWDYYLGWPGVVLALVFPLAIGFIFGYYPAQKAAKLRPIEALHYE